MRGKERAEVLNESLTLGYCSKKGKYFRSNIKGVLNKKFASAGKSFINLLAHS